MTVTACGHKLQKSACETVHFYQELVYSRLSDFQNGQYNLCSDYTNVNWPSSKLRGMNTLSKKKVNVKMLCASLKERSSLNKKNLLSRSSF